MLFQKATNGSRCSKAEALQCRSILAEARLRGGHILKISAWSVWSEPEDQRWLAGRRNLRWRGIRKLVPKSGPGQLLVQARAIPFCGMMARRLVSVGLATS